MGFTQLSSIEIQDLISRYKSELKKLEFQVQDIEETISGLESLYNVVVKQEKQALTARPRKSKSITARSRTSAGTKRRGRPAKKVETPATDDEQKKGYKLSGWDEAVIASLKESGKALITSEIVDRTAENAHKFELSDDREIVKKKVVRSLQKLVNRRGDLKKIKFKGKGFAYAIPDWVSEKGRLLKEYKR